jgi:hypothetical protein
MDYHVYTLEDGKRVGWVGGFITESAANNWVAAQDDPEQYEVDTVYTGNDYYRRDEVVASFGGE